MNKTSKSMLLAAALFSVVGTATGCGVSDNPNTLDIYITNAGYRYEWLYSIKDLFLEQSWVKEKYPDLKVTIFQNDDQTYAENLLKAGQSSNKFDLMVSMSMAGYAGSDDLLDLTDLVYNQKIPGTNTYYKDYIFDSYKESYGWKPKGNYGAEPKYYFAPWAGGMNGILYNETFFNQNDYKVPNTTDELIAIADDWYAKTWKGSHEATSQYVLIQGKDESYFDNLFDVFWGQYQTIEGYVNYFNGIDDGSLSRNIFKQQGRLKALEVMYELVGETPTYVSPKTSYQNFMSNQRNFLKGEALFNLNGDWFVSEMKQIRNDIITNRPDLNYSIKMMRTPIISDIIELCDTIEDDAELSALVAAIDANSNDLVGTGYNVNQDDFDTILAARTVVNSQGTTHQAAIPSYALCKDAAIDFVRFMATEEAQDAYIEATDGASLPFKYDLQNKNPELFAQIDPLHQARISYLNNAFINPYALPSRFNYPLLRYGGVDAFYLSGGYDFFNKMNVYGKKPQTYYDETIEYYTQERFEDACRRAGLI